MTPKILNSDISNCNIIDGVLHVNALSIDKLMFRYECPLCYTKYKKSGYPRKNARHTIHRHGSNGDITNRNEHRGSHCPAKMPVCIHITDETQRVGFI